MQPPTGPKETLIRETNNQKVHPQPMEEPTTPTPTPNQESPEALVSKIFTNISSLKSAYIQLQAAHTPYDPDKIEAADKLVISELKNLSELKHTYRENNPKPQPLSDSPQDSRLVAEIQEQQNLLKTYEVMVKKFQTQLQTKDSEIIQLQELIHESTQKRIKLEKKFKLRSLSEKNESISSSTDLLTPDLFISCVEASYKAIHDFSKPLINMMKASGWDLDAAANSIEPSVVYTKRSHKKYAFESLICQRMFTGFQVENLFVNSDEFLAIRGADPLDILSENPDSEFGKFCRSKYLAVVHPKMEASFFGNLDQRNHVMSGGHPRTPFYEAFLKLGKAVWVLQRLACCFEPKVKVFQVKRGNEFSEVYMESVVKNLVVEEEAPKVGLMVMPGFWIGGSVVQCRVYLSGVKCLD